MKKILKLSYLIVIIIILVNIIYYKNLYNKQIEYITTLLDHQVQLTGIAVEETNNSFFSDLNEIMYMCNLGKFFTDQDHKKAAIEKIKFFCTNYQDFINGIRICDNRKNEFTLKIDDGVWLEQQFVLHIQNTIYQRDTLVKENGYHEYYLPVFINNNLAGNIVVAIDYKKYFNKLFSVYKLKDYQWQWVLDDSGQLVFSNSDKKISYSGTEIITRALKNESTGNLIHKGKTDDKNRKIVSSYYLTQLLFRDLTLIFSSPTDYFIRFIVWHSFMIVIITLFIFVGVLYSLIRYIRNIETQNRVFSESKDSLLQVVGNISSGIIVYNRDRKILLANNMAAEQFSYQTASEMEGKTHSESSVSDINEYFAKNPGEGINRNRFEIIKKDSGDMILFKRSIPVNYLGEPAFIDIFTDVTELESLRIKEAKANRSKSEFLARLSYEIRTPLTGIIGMTDLLVREEVPDKIREIIDILSSSAADLMKIREDILDFSKIETGNLVLEEVPFNLRDEIYHCADPARDMLIRKNISFNTIVKPDVPVSIVADPYRFRQILSNLLLHSARNTFEGEIRLICRMLDNDKGHVKLEFELMDTGRAFDQATLNKIFGEFLNIESKVLTNNDETGFGPVMAAQLIRLMGGDLTVESPSGLSGESGTRICFTLRVYSNDRLEKMLDVSRITSFSDIRALIITDPAVCDDEILAVIHKLHLNVSVTNYQKSTIGQIRSNLDFAEEKYNLIIILNDNDFNGFDVASALWENKLHQKLVIIMISTQERKGNYLKSILLAVDHYLVMPLSINEIVNELSISFPFIELKNVVDEGKLKSGIRALVVEDNKINQKVVTRMLGLLGCTYDVAEDGNAGIQKATEKRYDIIFMDLILPGADGFESASRIIKAVPDSLIVALTADNMPESRSKAKLSGIKEFLTKPVRIEDIKKILSKYFIETNP